MQSINKQAPTPAFMTLLFGTAALSAGLGVYALMHRDEPHAGWLLGGSLSYLASIVLTACVPHPAQRQAGGDQSRRCGDRALLDDVRVAMDGRKPRAHADMRCSSRLLHDRVAQRKLTQFVRGVACPWVACPSCRDRAP